MVDWFITGRGGGLEGVRPYNAAVSGKFNSFSFSFSLLCYEKQIILQVSWHRK